MGHFSDCKSLDQAKNLFRKLCLELHPDKGGNHNDFIKMYNEFKSFKPSQNQNNDQKQEFNAEHFYNIVQQFEGLEGVNISFVGSFIWLEGNTMTYKDKIKSIHLDGYKSPTWARLKKAWFFSPSDYVKKSKKTTNLDEIKNLFGCSTFQPRTNLKLSY